MPDRNKVVIRLLMAERQYVCPQINIYMLAESTEVTKSVITDFVLAIPRQSLLFAPHRVKFGFTNICLHNAKNPHGICYRIYRQTIRLTADERQLRLEADMASFFSQQSFYEPQIEDARSIYRW